MRAAAGVQPPSLQLAFAAKESGSSVRPAEAEG